MRAVCALLLLGCAAPSGAPDAGTDAPASPLDAPVADPRDRTVNAVMVTRDVIFWSHGRFWCSLEDPCALEGPAVTSWWRGSNRAVALHQGGVGANSIVGDEHERFFVTGLDFESMYLVRDRGTPVAFSVPRPMTAGPAIDATHVYWADSSRPDLGYTLRRASRDGDGSDAIALATDVRLHPASPLVHAAGHVWWIADGGVHRVPDTGGAPARVALAAPEYPTAITARGDAVYLAAAPGSSTPGQVTELGRIDADGTYTRLVEQPSHNRWPFFLVATDDALYWSRRDGAVYTAPIGGGAIETISAGDQAGYAFAVLPDRILVELTGSGFRSIPR